MEKEILLSVKDIKKWFAIDEKIFGKPTSFVKAVDGVSFDIYKGEVLGLVGESGCGKTTIGRSILGLTRPTSGSIVFEGKELHILGYHFDLKNRALTEKLGFMAEKRRERNARLLKAIREKGYEIEEQDLIFREGQTYIGKPNFARALIKKGYINKVSEAFEPGRFLEDPQLKEIKKYLIPAEEALTIIRDAGGIPVLAHPCKIRGIGRRGSEEFRDSFSQLLKRLRQAGLKGLECIYPDHTEEERLFFIDEAARLHLHITEGSDFHGDR